MRSLRTALLTVLVVLLAAGPVAAAVDTFFDQVYANKVITTDLTVERTAIFGNTMYARAILSPTIDQLWAEIDRRGDAADARIVELQAQIHDLQNKVGDLQRRLTCVENKPQQVRPKCPTS